MLREFIRCAPLMAVAACGPAGASGPPAPTHAQVQETPATASPAAIEEAWFSLATADSNLAKLHGIPFPNPQSERLLSLELLATNTDLGTLGGRPDRLSFGLRGRSLDAAQAALGGKRAPAVEQEIVIGRANLAWERAAPEALGVLVEALVAVGNTSTAEASILDRYLGGRLASLAPALRARQADRWDASAIEAALDGFDALIDTGKVPETARAVLALRDEAEKIRIVPTGTRTDLLDGRIAAAFPGETVGTATMALDGSLPAQNQKVRTLLAAAGPTKERAFCTNAGDTLVYEFSTFLPRPHREVSTTAMTAEVLAIVDHDRRSLARWGLRAAMGRALLTDPAREPVLLATLAPADRHRILALVAADPLLPLRGVLDAPR